MKRPHVIDGIKVRIENPDLDGDGQSGEDVVETVTKQFNNQGDLTMIQQKTEMGETISELNLDKIGEGQKMSTIDLRSRIPQLAMSPLIGFESLISLGFHSADNLEFPKQCKRNWVSYEGEGRKEIVDIAVGRQQLQAQNGVGGWAKRMLGMRPNAETNQPIN